MKKLEGLDATKRIAKITLTGSFIDVTLGLLKISLGIKSHGHSLIADGLHSLSDFSGDLIVIGLSHLALKAPDKDHPYGHGKFETLGTVILGMALVGIASVLGFRSLERWWDHHYIKSLNYWAFLLTFASIVLKETMFQVMRKLSREQNSELLLASAWHSRTDAFSSVAVLIGLVGVWMGLPWMELLAAVVVSVMIGQVGAQFVWKAIKELTDTSLDPVLLEKMKNAVMGISGVKGLHEVRSRSSKGEYFLDLNIEVAPYISVSEGHQIALWSIKAVRDITPQIKDVVVHVDIEEDHHGNLDDVDNLIPLRESFSPQIKKIFSQVFPIENLLKISCHYGREDLLVEIFMKGQEPEKSKTLLSNLEREFKLPNVKEVKFLCWGKIP